MESSSLTRDRTWASWEAPNWILNKEFSPHFRGKQIVFQSKSWKVKEENGNKWGGLGGGGPGGSVVPEGCVQIRDSVQFSSVVQSCLTLCNPMDCSMPGFRLHHQLPELAQTHVHQVGDDIQPSHPLSSPSLPAFNLSQHQSLFKWVSSFLKLWLNAYNEKHSVFIIYKF